MYNVRQAMAEALAKAGENTDVDVVVIIARVVNRLDDESRTDSARVAKAKAKASQYLIAGVSAIMEVGSVSSDDRRSSSSPSPT